MSYDFLMQAIKILHTKVDDKSDLDFVYDYIVQTSDKTILDYKKKITIISYDNDVELFIEIINKLIKIYESENHEEYEKCNVLLNKKNRTLQLTT